MLVCLSIYETALPLRHVCTHRGSLVTYVCRTNQKPPLSDDKGGSLSGLFEIILEMLTNIGGAQATQGL